MPAPCPTTNVQRAVSRRRRLQWVLASLFVLILALGWKYVFLGFSVPLVMLVGIVSSVFSGRFMCGHLCPRGSFFDRLLAPVSSKKGIPHFLWRPSVRWSLFVVLMGVMVARFWESGADWRRLGWTFWTLCAGTTAVGVLLGLPLHPRAWCMICPMGTLQQAIGGRRQRLLFDISSCTRCKRCERVCTIGIPVRTQAAQGTLENPDCLTCSECVAACPAGCLRWPSQNDALPTVAVGGADASSDTPPEKRAANRGEMAR